MKKYKLIFIVFSIFILTGCNKNNEDLEINNEDININSFSDWIEQNLGTNVEKIYCPEINENSIMSGSGSVFVTDNNIYKYNLEQLFNNEKNCKLIGKNIDDKLVAVFKENAVAEDGSLYNDRWQKIDDENYNGDFVKDTKTEGFKNYFSKFNINKQLLSSSDIFTSNKVLDIPNYDIITYTDNGLYAYKLVWTDSDDIKEYKYKIDIDAIGNEKILKLYGTFLKTDRAFYMINSQKINKEKCEKYVDVECEYTYFLKKDEILTKFYDDILNITYSFIITMDYEIIDITDYVHMKIN